LNYCST